MKLSMVSIGLWPLPSLCFPFGWKAPSPWAGLTPGPELYQLLPSPALVASGAFLLSSPWWSEGQVLHGDVSSRLIGGSSGDL